MDILPVGTCRGEVGTGRLVTAKDADVGAAGLASISRGAVRSYRRCIHDTIHYFLAPNSTLSSSGELVTAAGGKMLHMPMTMHTWSPITLSVSHVPCSSSGELVTAAGGEVLGVLRSAPVVEALFDLYLGDQPVSKKAKVGILVWRSHRLLLPMLLVLLPWLSSFAVTPCAPAPYTPTPHLHDLCAPNVPHQYYVIMTLPLVLCVLLPPLIQAAAVDSLARMVNAHGAGAGSGSGLTDGGCSSYRYLPGPGERLRCANRQDLDTCVVEL